MDAKEANVEIRTIGKKRLAYVRHVGPYAGDSALFGRLFGKIYAWAGARGLLGPGTMTLVLFHDDPDTVAQDKLRTSVCVTVPDGQEASGEIGLMDLCAGQYGVGRFTVEPDGYGEAWNWMYGTWLPQSGFVPDDRQCFESYPEPVMADGRCVVEIWIPVKPA